MIQFEREYFAQAHSQGRMFSAEDVRACVLFGQTRYCETPTLQNFTPEHNCAFSVFKNNPRLVHDHCKTKVLVNHLPSPRVLADQTRILVVGMPAPWNIRCPGQHDLKTLVPAAKAMFKKNELCGCTLEFGSHQFDQTLKNCRSTLEKGAILDIRYPINTAVAYAFRGFISELQELNGNSLAIISQHQKVIIDGNTQLRHQFHMSLPRIPQIDLENVTETNTEAVYSMQQIYERIAQGPEIEALNLTMKSTQSRTSLSFWEKSMILVSVTLGSLALCLLLYYGGKYCIERKRIQRRKAEIRQPPAHAYRLKAVRPPQNLMIKSATILTVISVTMIQGSQALSFQFNGTSTRECLASIMRGASRGTENLDDVCSLRAELHESVQSDYFSFGIWWKTLIMILVSMLGLPMFLCWKRFIQACITARLGPPSACRDWFALHYRNRTDLYIELATVGCPTPLQLYLGCILGSPTNMGFWTGTDYEKEVLELPDIGFERRWYQDIVHLDWQDVRVITKNAEIKPPGSLVVWNPWKRRIITKILDTYCLDRMIGLVGIYNEQYRVVNITCPALNNCCFPSIPNPPSVRKQKRDESCPPQPTGIAFGTTSDSDGGNKTSCIVEIEPCKCTQELPCAVHPKGMDTKPEELFKPNALVDVNREGYTIEFENLIGSREPVTLHVKREEMMLSTLIESLESGRIKDRRKIKFPLKDQKGNPIDFDKTTF